MVSFLVAIMARAWLCVVAERRHLIRMRSVRSEAKN